MERVCDDGVGVNAKDNIDRPFTRGSILSPPGTLQSDPLNTNENLVTDISVGLPDDPW